MEGEQGVETGRNSLRERIRTLEVQHGHTERALADQAALTARMDAKLDRIIETQAQASGSTSAVKWITGLAAGAAGGIAGALATVFGGHH